MDFHHDFLTISQNLIGDPHIPRLVRRGLPTLETLKLLSYLCSRCHFRDFRAFEFPSLDFRATPRPCSPSSTACLGDFRVGSWKPATGDGQWCSGCCLQWLHHHARTSWSAVHMDHRAARVRRDSLTDRAGQLDPRREALLRCSAYGIIEHYA